MSEFGPLLALLGVSVCHDDPSGPSGTVLAVPRMSKPVLATIPGERIGGCRAGAAA
jgi:hypothetical protein